MCLAVPMQITRLDGLDARCSAQVMYREEKGRRVMCGVAILDMDLTHYSRLTQILAHHDDLPARVSCVADMDMLWEFLFAANVIDPGKYRSIHEYRNGSPLLSTQINSPEIIQRYM